MNTSLLDRAIVFAVRAHAGTPRKGKNFPYIVHPLEAVAIVATMTDDPELLAAAALHDTIEDTATTREELQQEFGPRVADLVQAESDIEVDGLGHAASWRERKQVALDRLASAPREVQIVALGDKLSNMRAIARDYARQGDALWQIFNVKDPAQHAWRYRALVNALAPLADTEAYREFKALVDTMFSGWPSSR